MLDTYLYTVEYKELSWGTGWQCTRMLAETKHRKSQGIVLRLTSHLQRAADDGGDHLQSEALLALYRF
jgi:hypothetical protein